MPKKATKKKNQTKEEKYTLLELVEKSSLRPFKMIMNLSENDLLTQYELEKEQAQKGEIIEPTMTMKEFDKIMEE